MGRKIKPAPEERNILATRLTNGYSKKLDNLKAARALYFAYYNFCRVHQSIRVSPAVEAGIADHI